MNDNGPNGAPPPLTLAPLAPTLFSCGALACGAAFVKNRYALLVEDWRGLHPGVPITPFFVNPLPLVKAAMIDSILVRSMQVPSTTLPELLCQLQGK